MGLTNNLFAACASSSTRSTRELPGVTYHLKGCIYLLFLWTGANRMFTVYSLGEWEVDNTFCIRRMRTWNRHIYPLFWHFIICFFDIGLRQGEFVDLPLLLINTEILFICYSNYLQSILYLLFSQIHFFVYLVIRFVILSHISFLKYSALIRIRLRLSILQQYLQLRSSASFLCGRFKNVWRLKPFEWNNH